ncbi:hypothetical protein KUCAC02_015532 [Chaenocephalus aceratus]|uniref:Uncharacterized protein n=1 Tax=Chaenocephalus aceratus TaxID=36190 RepID=A0ACB9Y034_CHAAC|nr:hypothetical protein KUCAC02_015532 [Chaenocephalus aceratus]
MSNFYSLSPGGVGQITPPLGWFSHHMVPGPQGPHATGIPHPAIVNHQVKHEPPHETDIMHIGKCCEPPEVVISDISIIHGQPSFQKVRKKVRSGSRVSFSVCEFKHLALSYRQCAVDEKEAQHEQRKEQEPKRPHIKKPLNAFMLYMKEMRANVVAECTLKESAAINQILGRRWHALTREEQAKYYELARKERQLHMQLYPGWSARDNYGKKKKRKREKMQESAPGTGQRMKTAYI